MAPSWRTRSWGLVVSIEHLARPRVRRGGVTGGTEHEAWVREDTEVIDFFAPPRDDFLLGGKPAYMSEG